MKLIHDGKIIDVEEQTFEIVVYPNLTIMTQDGTKLDLIVNLKHAYKTTDGEYILLATNELRKS